MSYVVQNHQKHAQSTYLDEYLWFLKNLAEKILLEKFLEHFETHPVKNDEFYYENIGFVQIS